MTTSSKRTHRRNKLNRFFYIFMCFVLVIGLSTPTSAIGDATQEAPDNSGVTSTEASNSENPNGNDETESSVSAAGSALGQTAGESQTTDQTSDAPAFDESAQGGGLAQQQDHSSSADASSTDNKQSATNSNAATENSDNEISVAASNEDPAEVNVTSDMFRSASLHLYTDRNLKSELNSGDTVTDGEFVYGRLSFAFDNSHLPQKNTTYVFTFDDTLDGVYAIEHTNTVYIQENGVNIGTAHFSQNKIYVTYYSDWLDTHTSGISGEITFESNIQGNGMTPGNTITVHAQNVADGPALTLQQSYRSRFDQSSPTDNFDGTFTFTSLLSSDGTMNNVSYDEYMVNALEYEQGSFSLTDENNNTYPISVNVENPSGASYSHVHVTVQGELPANTQLTLTHTARFTDETLATMFRTAQPTRASYRTWEIILPGASDGHTNSGQWHANGQDLEYSYDDIGYVGQNSVLLTSDSGSNSDEVNWTVDVNNSVEQTNDETTLLPIVTASTHILSLNGASFTGNVPNGLTYRNGSLKLYSKTWSNDQWSEPTELNLDDYGTLSESNNTWTFTFTHDTHVGNDPVTDYYFTYTTTINNPSVPARYEDSATVTMPYGGSEKVTGSYDHTTGNVQDDVVSLSAVNAPGENDVSWNGTANWRIVSNMSEYAVHSANNAQHMSLTDTLSSYDNYGKDYNNGGSEGTSEDDLYYNKDSVSVSYTANGVSGTLQQGTDYTIAWTNRAGDSNPEHATQMTIQFNDTDAAFHAMSGTITTTYTTSSPTKYAGYYGGHVEQKYYSMSNTAEAGFNYHPNATNPAPIQKTLSSDSNYSYVLGEYNPYYHIYVNVAPSSFTNGDDGYYASGLKPDRDLNEETLTITDTLPKDVTIFKNTDYMRVFSHNSYQRLNRYQGDYQLDVTNNEDGTQTLTWTIDTKAVQSKFGSNYHYTDFAFDVEYRAIVVPQYSNLQNNIDYVNTATAHTQTYDFGRAQVTLHAHNYRVFPGTFGGTSKTDGNEKSYVVDVNWNLEGKNLVQINNGNLLNVVITLDPRETFEPDSIEVYDWTDQYHRITLNSSDYTLRTTTVKDSNGNDRTQVIVGVPDGRYVRVVYNARIAGNIGDTVSDLNNYVTMEQFDPNGFTFNEDSFTITQNSGSSQGNSVQLQLTKNNAANAREMLPGAQFALYRVDTSSWANGAHNGAGTSAVTDDMCTKVAEGTTDANGNLTFGTENLVEGTPAVQTSTLYYYQETAAPDGYQSDNTRHFFILRPGNDADQTAYQAELERDQEVLGSDLWVPGAQSANRLVSNEPNAKAGLALLTAHVTLTDSTGAVQTMTDGQFTFNVKDEAGNQLYLDQNGNVTTSTTNTPLTTTSAADGTITFPTMHFATAGSHAVVLSQQIPDGATQNADGSYTLNGITYDGSTHTVTFDTEYQNGYYGVRASSVTVDGDPLVASNVTTSSDGAQATINTGVTFRNIAANGEAPTPTPPSPEPQNNGGNSATTEANGPSTAPANDNGAAAANEAENAAPEALAKTSDIMIGFSVVVIALIAGGVAWIAYRQRRGGKHSQR